MAKDSEGARAKTAAELIHDAPCGIAVTDADGRLEYLNRTLIDWLGLPKDADGEGRTLPGLLTLPGKLYYETHIAPMLRIQGFVREISCKLAVADGDPMPVLLSATGRLDDDGELYRVDYTVFDARERYTYEEELRRARREADELAAIVRTSPNAIIRMDAAGLVKSWNGGAERLLRRPADDAVGQPIAATLRLAGDLGRLEPPFEKHPAVFDDRLPDGQEVEVTLAPIGERGRPDETEWSLIIRDVSAQKNAERRLTLMIDEMRHRMKNIFGVILVIARQTLSVAARETFIPRLQALSRAQDALTRTNWTSADLGELLRLTAEEAGGADRIRASGPAVELTPQVATSMSMALHELTTNAIKYGALSSPSGHVRVDWHWEVDPAAENDRLRLVWQERDGPAVTPPKTEGFGSKMINVVLKQNLAAQVSTEFNRDGVRCEVRFAP